MTANATIFIINHTTTPVAALKKKSRQCATTVTGGKRNLYHFRNPPAS